MNFLFDIVLFFRLRHKSWGDLYMRHHKKQIDKIVASIDINISDIKIVPHDHSVDVNGSCNKGCC